MVTTDMEIYNVKKAKTSGSSKDDRLTSEDWVSTDTGALKHMKNFAPVEEWPEQLLYEACSGECPEALQALEGEGVDMRSP